MVCNHLQIFLLCCVQKQAKWLDISLGKFELTEWHRIAEEWFKEKPRNSDQVPTTTEHMHMCTVRMYTHLIYLYNTIHVHVCNITILLYTHCTLSLLYIHGALLHTYMYMYMYMSCASCIILYI